MELSKYAKRLLEIDQVKYIQKVNMVFSKDPYILNYSEQYLPTNVSYINIMNYLLYSRSSETNKRFKALKSLNADKLYEGGWVQSLAGHKTANFIFVFAKVLHSQTLNATPLQVWIAIDCEGIIKTAHCNCIAGLGETCSHVGAALFGLEAINRKVREENIKSVTDVKAYWKIPSCKTNLQVFCDKISWHSNNNAASTSTSQHQVSTSSDTDAVNFFRKLREAGMNVVGMTSFNEFNSVVESQSATINKYDVEIEELIFIYMNRLYKNEYVGVTAEQLNVIGSQINFKLETSKADMVEKLTKEQSKCKYWHKLRLGRITPSIFKQAARTKLSPVSLSLLNKICHISEELHVPAIKYGCQHENMAIKYISTTEKVNHSNLKIEKCGLFIDCEKSYYACSPDALWKCDCCGIFPIEVKCPFCLKDGDVNSWLSKENCPIILENNNYIINKSHQYYWQVQLQCSILKAEYGYFCIYSPKLKVLIKVKFDNDFFMNEISKTDRYFFNVVILEILGLYFSNQPKKICDVLSQSNK